MVINVQPQSRYSGATGNTPLPDNYLINRYNNQQPSFILDELYVYVIQHTDIIKNNRLNLNHFITKIVISD